MGPTKVLVHGAFAESASAQPILDAAEVRASAEPPHQQKQGGNPRCPSPGQSPVVLEQASQEFVEATAAPPFLYELTPAEARKVLGGDPPSPSADRPGVLHDELSDDPGPRLVSADAAAL
jgi:hypothetical protein